MKAAYLAYDRNSLAAGAVLSTYFEQVDFFIADDVRPAIAVNLDAATVMTDTVQIPAEAALQTRTHQQALKSIQKELVWFKNILQIEVPKNTETQFENTKSIKPEIHLIASIKDIVINSKTNDVYIERENIGVTQYQGIFIEDHQIVADHLGSFSKNIFKRPPVNSHVWFSVEFTYELKKPRENNLGQRHFTLIKDRMNKSILDNWYFVRTQDQIITVQQWLPINQVKNSDFQKFIIERVEKILKAKLDLLQISQFNQMYVNASPGFSLGKTALLHNKISTLMPSFNFWPQRSVDQFLYQKLDPKMKDLAKFKLAQASLRGSP